MSNEDDDDAERYCSCRSTISDGFMICCERCDEWFHGECIKMTKKQSKNIDKWYCQECLSIESTLAIVYKPGTSIETNTTTNIKKEKLNKAQKEKPSQDKISSERNANTKNSKDKIIKEKQQNTVKIKKEDNNLEKVQQENIPNRGKAARKERQSRNSGRNYNSNSTNRKRRSANIRQCENPPCIEEARKNSNFCSDKCGLELGKERIKRHFIPKWDKLKNNPSETTKRFKEEMVNLELSRLEHTKKIDDIIQSLYKLERDIKTIKEAGRNAKQPEKDEEMVSEEEEEEEDENEELEEVTSAEVTKTFCVTCGSTILSDNAFKHWANCFKKHEACFNVSSERECTFGTPENRHPPVFCETLNTKTKQYCKRFRGICVEHRDPDLVNTKKDDNEICGCPLEIQQELTLDGNNCQEKKSECTLHYEWDKFRKAQLNLTRLQHYFKLEEINEKMRVCSNNLEDSYGGIVGLMSHKTTDEKSQLTSEVDGPFSGPQEDIDCES